MSVTYHPGLQLRFRPIEIIRVQVGDSGGRKLLSTHMTLCPALSSFFRRRNLPFSLGVILSGARTLSYTSDRTSVTFKWLLKI